MVVLIVPKLIGVQEYGYWQLYLFYSTYVGFMHFGWIDGIYLKYGGKEYNSLDKQMFFSQFYMLAIQQLIIVAIIFFVTSHFILDTNKIFIFQMISLCMLISNTRFLLIYILQCTNRIKEFSKIIISDRVLYCCLLFFLILMGIRDYKLLIAADLIGKLVSLFYAMYCCKDIVFYKLSKFYFSFRETIENISIGIKLMFANIANLLIIGMVRYGIEHTWDVSTFGKVSLTLSISNLFMLFINALGIIIYPILRRVNKNKLSEIYLTIREVLIMILLGALIFYYPIKVFFLSWLPQYAESLIYMAILFPMCVFEGKMGLLINTFFNTLRQEKLILKVNIITLILSGLITILTTFYYQNLNLAIASIVIILAFRSFYAEITLSKILKISITKSLVLEILMVLIFILSSWYIDTWHTLLFYSVSYLLYLIIKRREIVIAIKNIKLLIKG